MGNNKITLYHNTNNANAIKINTTGIKGGLRLDVYGKGSEAEGAGVWCTNVRGYGYGGATITFEIDKNDEALRQQNDTQYIVYRDIKPEEIIDIDLVMSDISSIYTVTHESDVPKIIEKFGKEKCISVFEKYKDKFVEPYNLEQFYHLIETGEKYCRGTINLVESNKITENTNKEEVVTEINKIIDTCRNHNLLKELRNYTIPAMRDYLLRFNPTADSRKNPWRVLIEEIVADNDSSELDEFIDRFIKEGNQCIKDNLKTESKKVTEGMHLLAIVKDPDSSTGGLKVLEDDDYSSKEAYRNDLKRNGYTVKGVYDDKDLYIREHSDYESVAAVKKELKKYQQYFEEGGGLTWQRHIEELQDLLKMAGVSKKTEDKMEIFDEPKKSKLEEASRNELLAKSKAETITRYNKSAGYKGFSLVDIDTTAIKTRDAIVITNRVGNYFDTVELEDILYWVGLEVDEARDKKLGLEVVRRALLGAMDGMDIRVDCNCGDFVYRFAYMSTVLDYKYGKPENRPSNITNPNGYGAMCKHLIALLSNKSWVKQVATTLQQWIIDNIDWVRKFLKVTEEDFQLPDELARSLGKHGAMKKFWDKQPDIEEADEEQDEDIDDNNKDGESDNKNDEPTNDTSKEKPTLNNQSNMPKAFRDDNQEDELEDK